MHEAGSVTCRRRQQDSAPTGSGPATPIAELDTDAWRRGVARAKADLASANEPSAPSPIAQLLVHPLDQESTAS